MVFTWTVNWEQYRRYLVPFPKFCLVKKKNFEAVYIFYGMVYENNQKQCGKQAKYFGVVISQVQLM
jgi:hypothetical protein